MEQLQQLGAGFEFVLGWKSLAIIMFGVTVGLIVGAMPGLSPSTGVALLVPFTYAMDPTLAIVLLAAIYQAADYGGSITAVTINTPGTPSSVVTAFDGYPLTQQGKAGIALGVSLVASVVGGLLGTIVLIFFSRPLSDLALSFDRPEYFAIAVFGLTSAIALGGRSWGKSVLMTSVGLLIYSVGLDPITGVERFTFGYAPLYDGFSLIPALIGLFAISEVLTQIQQAELDTPMLHQARTVWPTIRDYVRLGPTIFIASLVGTVIGIFPGAGATVASFVAYDLARRMSRSPEQFGKGSTEGVAAAEAANSSSVGGALIPLLTLGIPGSASTAVLVGALMIHDVVPGPTLLDEHPQVVYGLLASLFLANAASLILGFFGSRIWVRVCYVPKPLLFCLILSVSFLGSFAVRNSMFDVACCLGFGFVGWFLRRHDFPVVPIVLGMVLGSIIESNFRQAVMKGGYGIFFRHPVCVSILFVSALAVIAPLVWRRAATKES